MDGYTIIKTFLSIPYRSAKQITQHRWLAMIHGRDGAGLGGAVQGGAGGGGEGGDMHAKGRNDNEAGGQKQSGPICRFDVATLNGSWFFKNLFKESPMQVKNVLIGPEILRFVPSFALLAFFVPGIALFRTNA